MEFVRLSPQHEDVVTDISFDYYGKRFATCSTDKHIKIWTLLPYTIPSHQDHPLSDPSNHQNVSPVPSTPWSCYDIPSAHTESVWRLSWAHPEYGSLIASCSEDHNVCIWEEQETVISRMPRDKWKLKATLSESKRAVNDVKFSPKHLGLKVATASADGFVRIYEANDLFSLSFWQVQDTLHVEDVVKDDSVDKAPNGSSSEHGLTCISWCDSPFETPRLAVGGYSHRAVVWAQLNGKWVQESVLGTHGDTVHDIAWAPGMGRSYHLIATASRETTFQVHTLIRKENILEYTSSAVVNTVNNSPVWRVTWNATGTVLATTSEDGTLALFRRNFSGSWINIQSLPAGADQFRSFYRNT